MSVEKNKSPILANIKMPKMPDVSRLSLSGIGSPLSDKSFFDESITPAKLRDLLDKKNYKSAAGVAERIRGMKWLLAQMSMGIDVSEFFTSVVKNVIVKNVELKKLVYMFLTHYADASIEIRELALLSINSFQKDLASPNQLIRALALRVLTAIRIREIVGIQITALTKCAGDSSPYVRKTAAHALTKLYNLDHETKDDLIKILQKLLNDRSTIVLGSVIAAFAEICPERMDLLHKHFRKLCSRLSDIDSWGQIVLLRILTRYSRTQFLNPRIDLNTGEEVIGNPEQHLYSGGSSLNDSLVGATTSIAKSSMQSALEAALDSGGKGFYSDDEEDNDKMAKMDKGKSRTKVDDNKGDNDDTKKNDKDTSSNDNSMNKVSESNDEKDTPKNNDEKSGKKSKKKKKRKSKKGNDSMEENKEDEEEFKPEIKLRGVQDKDHRRLLAASLPLLKSSNAGVVLQVASLHWYLGSRKNATLSKVVKALCRLAFRNKEVQTILLEHMVAFAKDRPELFRPYLSDFFVQCANDTSTVRTCKLKMLCLLADQSNIDQILREMTEYVRHSDVEFGKTVIQSVGRLAADFEENYPNVIHGLTAMVALPTLDEELVGEAIVAIRMLVQKFKSKDIEAEKKKKEEEDKLAEEKKKKKAEGDDDGNGNLNESVELTLDDISSDDDSDDSDNDNDSDDGNDKDSPKSQKKKKKRAKKKLKKKKKKLKKRIKKRKREKARLIHEENMKDPVIMLARLLDRVKVPSARASIIWIIGEFQYKPALFRMAPDALRRLAISFKEESAEVKLQIANLAMKLFLQREDHEMLKLLVGYIMELGFYDLNHDVRDRYRFLRGVLQTESLRDFAKSIYLGERPEPEMSKIATYQDRLEWGSLSVVVNHIAFGYTHIPDFPSVQPDVKVREPPAIVTPAKKSLSSSSSSTSSTGRKSMSAKRNSVSRSSRKKSVVDSDSSVSSDTSSSDSSDSSGSSSSDSSSDDGEDVMLSDEETDLANVKLDDASDNKKPNRKSKKESSSDDSGEESSSSSSSSSGSSSDSSDSSSSDSDDSSDDEEGNGKKKKGKNSKKKNSKGNDSPKNGETNSNENNVSQSPVPPAPATTMDLLSFSPSISPQVGQLPMSTNDLKSYIAMDKVQGRGLEAKVRFLRDASSFGNTCIVVQLSLLNTRDESLNEVEVNPDDVGESKALISVFDKIEVLDGGVINCMHVKIHVDLQVKRDGIKFSIQAKDFGSCVCTLNIPIGETLRPKHMSIEEFKNTVSTLGGMNEASTELSGKKIDDLNSVMLDIKQLANVGECLNGLDNNNTGDEPLLYLAGEDIVNDTLVLIRISGNGNGGIKIIVNSSDVLLTGQILEAFGNFK